MSANVKFGDEKYSGLIQVASESDRSLFAAFITLAEWHEWNNGEETTLSEEQLNRFLDGLTTILASNGSYVEVLFGWDKYAGRLTRLHQDQAIVDIAEWSEWDNSVTAVITAEQARQILALFNR
jgi:hypothetical protein